MTLRQHGEDEREEKVLRFFDGRKIFKRADLISKTGWPVRTLDKTVDRLVVDGKLVFNSERGIGNRGGVRYYHIPDGPRSFTRNDVLEEGLGILASIATPDQLARVRDELMPRCGGGICF